MYQGNVIKVCKNDERHGEPLLKASVLLNSPETRGAVTKPGLVIGIAFRSRQSGIASGSLGGQEHRSTQKSISLDISLH